MGADLYRKNENGDWEHSYRDSYGPADAMLWFLGLSWWESLAGVNQNDAEATLAFEREFLATIRKAAEVKFGPDAEAHMRAYIEAHKVHNPLGEEGVRGQLRYFRDKHEQLTRLLERSIREGRPLAFSV